MSDLPRVATGITAQARISTFRKTMLNGGGTFIYALMTAYGEDQKFEEAVAKFGADLEEINRG